MIHCLKMMDSIRIFRKPSLISSVKTSFTWNSYLATMYMPTDYQIDLPCICCLPKNKTIWSVRQHDLKCICVLIIHQKISYFGRNTFLNHISSPIYCKCILIKASNPELVASYLYILIFFLYNLRTCFL